MYFAIYQALAEDERRAGLFRDYPPDFFDLIIVDECHRGSARDDSSWRVILEHFKPAYQLGMTATPLREDNRDTYLYFGNPIFEYSLRQGIDDGFLAPYRVHRIVTQWDAVGWRPRKDEVDRFGRAIPDDEYQTKDFERIIALRARTEAIARHLTDFLKKTDRFAKTIVFCVDQEHASEMRQALVNLNADLVAQYPDYVARVAAGEGFPLDRAFALLRTDAGFDPAAPVWLPNANFVMLMLHEQLAALKTRYMPADNRLRVCTPDGHAFDFPLDSDAGAAALGQLLLDYMPKRMVAPPRLLRAPPGALFG